MADLVCFPTDGADGSVSSEARWRKMARLWVPSGVDSTPLGVGGGLGALAPTLQAGPQIQVAAGGAWLDGHYGELAAPATIPATANGLLVIRFTPADNRMELLFRDAAVSPTQTLATWELVIASMAAGVMTDQRRFAILGGIQTTPACILRTTANVSHPQGTIPIPFGAGTEVVDTANMHDVVTTNERIFAPVRGIYLAAAHAAWTGTDNGNYRIAGIANQAAVTLAQSQGPIYGGGSIAVAVHALMNAGDWLRMIVVRDGTAAMSVIAGAQFSMALVAPAP